MYFVFDHHKAKQGKDSISPQLSKLTEAQNNILSLQIKLRQLLIT